MSGKVAKDRQEHDQHFCKVQGRLKREGIAQCQEAHALQVTSVKFPEALARFNRISLVPDDMQIIRGLPPPTGVPGVRRFLHSFSLAFLSYYSTHNSLSITKRENRVKMAQQLGSCLLSSRLPSGRPNLSEVSLALLDHGSC